MSADELTPAARGTRTVWVALAIVVVLVGVASVAFLRLAGRRHRARPRLQPKSSPTLKTTAGFLDAIAHGPRRVDERSHG